jgi:hypothetical protein
MSDKPKGVSPVNGQPLPRGKPFTSETAREARRKRAEKEAEQSRITDAFKKRMNETFTDKKTGKTMTGAEIIADSIIKGANNGNAKMVEIALALMGETPVKKIDVSADDPLLLLLDRWDRAADEQSSSK